MKCIQRLCKEALREKIICTPQTEIWELYKISVFYFLTIDAGLLAKSQYSEGPAAGHLDTGFSSFPCVYKQVLR